MDDGHEGKQRVVRGGSWNNDARNVRAAYRNANPPEDRNDNLGFRLARAHGWIGDPLLTRPASRPLLLGSGEQRRARRCAGSSRSSAGEGSPASPI